MLDITHTKTPTSESIVIKWQGETLFEGTVITPQDLFRILEKTNIAMRLNEVTEFQ